MPVIFRGFFVLLITQTLLLACNSTLQLNYNFRYSYKTGQFPSQEYFSIYDLGELQAGYSITLNLFAPNTASSVELGLHIADLYLGFTTPQAPGVVLPAFTFINQVQDPYKFPPANGNKPFYSATYNITFPNTDLTSAHFKIYFNDYDQTIFDAFVFTYLSIQVLYFQTSNVQSYSKGQPVRTILRATDPIRTDIFKVIYVETDNSTFNFSVSPRVVPITNQQFPRLYLYRLLTESQYTIGNERTFAPLNNYTPLKSLEEQKAVGDATPIFINNIAHYSFVMPERGFYIFECYFKPSNYKVYDTEFDVRLTFNTDPYACPYNPEFPDVYQSFQGCTPPISNKGFPCKEYDDIMKVCRSCIPAYSLINGTCFANTTCPARQYYRFGSCYNVSQTCGTFDVFTGNCLTCSDSVIFQLDNGNCVPVNITCGPRQWKSGRSCVNVSTTCEKFNTSTGSCITCQSNLYQLNSDGTCTLIVINCPPGQYASGLICLTIHSECSAFNTTTATCTACIQGYLLKNGTCTRIVCPEGQVPASVGINCVNISPLCAGYDRITGDCLSCKFGGYSLRSGQCVQTSSPLAGCKQRQILGFGPCFGNEANCKVMDLSSGNCNQCVAGFYIDFTGHCVQNAKCGGTSASANGQCMTMPANCLQIDNLGLCTKCDTGDYKIVTSQCVYFKSCHDHQYLNSGGQCIDVDSNCVTWNPSNGQCVTCINGSSPTSGVCCPLGEVYTSGKCSDSVANRVLNQPAAGITCLLPHPSLGVCLQCPPGYDPDYTAAYSCSLA